MNWNTNLQFSRTLALNLVNCTESCPDHARAERSKMTDNLPLFLYRDVYSLYDKFTKCTMMGAHEASCFWPNPSIDEIFSEAHHLFFANCSLDHLADPPPLILGLLIALPSVLTITTTVAVLCIVKRHEGKV
uniref:Receptor activity modifying protein 3 n=1 Tax=Eptatretus burgeri TaxID=7764 RepID=A0A8C4PZU6_EPTBU